MSDDWPRNNEGRYLCTAERPMPPDHRERFGTSARWQHDKAECIGDTSCGAGDRFVCQSCGVAWTCWYDD